MGGSKTTSTTTVTQTAEEKEYTKQQIELAKQQLQFLQEEHGWQSEIYTLTKPLLQKYSLMVEQDFAEMQTPEYQAMKAKQAQLDSLNLDSALRQVPIQEELLQRQLDEIRRGGAATDEQKALIKQIADRAIETGQGDINRFLGSGLDQVRNQMAPARGMRPDDGPMVDAAQRVLEEAVRSQGQLSSQVRGAQADAELNFPLNAGNITNGWNQWQQTYNQNMNQFMSGLKDKAVQNRTALMGQLFASPMTASERGMNLINASRPNPVDFPRNTTTTQKQSGGSILGGIGGLLSGIGSVGAMFSSRQGKENIRPIEAPPGHLLSPGALKQNINPIIGAAPIDTTGPIIDPAGPGARQSPSTVGLQGHASLAGGSFQPRYPGMPQPMGNAPKPPPQPPRDDEDVLARLRQMPVSTWQYKPETGLGGPTHVGPMAEDFNTIMMGKAPEPFINTVDAVGSLMAGVKALDRKISGLGMAKPRRRQFAFPGG